MVFSGIIKILPGKTEAPSMEKIGQETFGVMADVFSGIITVVPGKIEAPRVGLKRNVWNGVQTELNGSRNG